MKNITTKQALLIAAAAVIAHPFLNNVVSGWGKYPSLRAADIACEKWADQRGTARVAASNRKTSIRTCAVRIDEGVIEGWEHKGVKDGGVVTSANGEQLAGKYWRF